MEEKIDTMRFPCFNAQGKKVSKKPLRNRYDMEETPKEVIDVIQQRIIDIEDSKPKLYHCDACNEDVQYPKIHEMKCSKFFLLGIGDRKIRLVSTNKE